MEKNIQLMGVGIAAVVAIAGANPIKLGVDAKSLNLIGATASTFTIPCKNTEGKGILTREQENRLLKVKPGTSRKDVEKALGEPFCNLDKVNAVPSSELERLVYQSAVPGNGFYVLGFQGDDYTGFTLVAKPN